MAIPTNKEEFKQFCLRSLGHPVIEINVSEEQVDDRVDQALRYYWDYHFDGTEKTYFKHEIDENFIETREITLPENIIGAVKLFDIGTYASSSKDLFNIRYQIALNDLYTITNIGLQNYYMTMVHLGVIQEMLTGSIPIRYNRHRNILHVDRAKEHFTLGQFLLIEAYEVVDPEIYPDVWADRWLQNYTIQLIKKNWGANLTKFEGIQLPGGVTFNGNKIYDDAVEEIRKMEEEMINNYSLPVADMVG